MWTRLKSDITVSGELTLFALLSVWLFVFVFVCVRYEDVRYSLPTTTGAIVIPQNHTYHSGIYSNVKLLLLSNLPSNAFVDVHVVVGESQIDSCKTLTTKRKSFELLGRFSLAFPAQFPVNV